MYIYADIVLLINLLMNILILLCTAWALKVPFKRWRLLSAAVIGSIYALGEVIPVLAFLYLPVMKVLFSVMLVYIAYGFNSLRKLVLLVGGFYLISFILGGAVIGWLFFSHPAGVFLHKAISWQILAGGSLLAVGFMFMTVNFITNHFIEKTLFYQVHITLGERSVKLKGFLDTGNHLYSVVGHKPVVVVNYSAVKTILSAEVIQYLDTTESEAWLHCLDKCQDQQWLSRVEFIPYHGVGSQSVLLGFRPDKFTVRKKDMTVHAEVIIGIYAGQLSPTGSYEVLLHPKVLEYKNDREVNICA